MSPQVSAPTGVIWGKLFAEWFGYCTTKGDETQVLVDNAMSCAEQYALEAGLKRCNSRVGATATRAGWFVRDVPAHMCNAEWLLVQGSVRGYVARGLAGAPLPYDGEHADVRFLAWVVGEPRIRVPVRVSPAVAGVFVGRSVARAYCELQ